MHFTNPQTKTQVGGGIEDPKQQQMVIFVFKKVQQQKVGGGGVVVATLVYQIRHLINDNAVNLITSIKCLQCQLRSL